MATPRPPRPPVSPESILSRLELGLELKLTAAARSLLLLPLEDLKEYGAEVNLPELEKTFASLLETARDAPDPLAGDDPIVRTSLAIIAAFSKRFCNIPPFCGRKGNHRGRRREG